MVRYVRAGVGCNVTSGNGESEMRKGCLDLPLLQNSDHKNKTH